MVRYGPQFGPDITFLGVDRCDWADASTYADADVVILGAPFDGGLEGVVTEYLQFLGLAAIGVFLGFTAMIVLGKDWKSRGLKRYEETYKKRPHRPVRG